MHSRGLVMEEQFGEAMRALPIQEQIFVSLLFSGLSSLTKAAEQAGYRAVTRAALRVQAHRLLHKPSVGAAMIEESKRRTQFLLPKAQKALDNLLDHPEHADHFKAVKLTREENGLAPVVKKQVEVNVSVAVKDSEKIERIRAFALSHGIDPTKLLGFDTSTADPVDVEFAELSQEDEDRALGII